MMGWTPTAMAGTMLRGPLDLAGVLVDACAEGSRFYWGLWGPLGAPVIATVDAVAGMQRRYLAWLTDAVERAMPD